MNKKKNINNVSRHRRTIHAIMLTASTLSSILARQQQYLPRPRVSRAAASSSSTPSSSAVAAGRRRPSDPPRRDGTMMRRGNGRPPLAFQQIAWSTTTTSPLPSLVGRTGRSVPGSSSRLSLFGDDDGSFLGGGGGDDGRDRRSETSSSRLPYSTTSSTPSRPSAAADGGASLASRSSSPFRAPRSSFDDSLPATMVNNGHVGGSGKNVDGSLEWSKLGLLTELVDAVVGDANDRRGLGLIDGPTPVQRMAIPEILMACKDRMAHVETDERKGGGKSSSSSWEDGVTMGGNDGTTTTTTTTTIIPPARSIAFAAATGSGKTLAYILPIVQSLRAQELMALGDVTNELLRAEALSRLRRPRRPRALVLAPTRELARQILSVLKSVGHVCKVSSDILVGGDDYSSQRKRLSDRPVDVLVATPGRLVKHRDAGDVYLGSVRHVVIDEMDTMLEQGFQGDLGKLLHPMLYRKKVVEAGEYRSGKLLLAEGAPQVILTTATLTPAVRRALDRPELPFEPKRVYGKQNSNNSEKKNGGGGGVDDDDDEEDANPNAVKIALPRDIRVLTAPGLHRVVPRLKQVFVNVGGADKLSLLVDIVAGGERRKRDGRNGCDDDDDDGGGGGGPLPLTLVFCNTVASCRAAEHALAESGVSSLCYHGDLNSADREGNLREFRRVGTEGDGASVLVCTDIASRGLDVPHVDHVVMFDFPLNPIDYLHRAGRTARGMGGSTGAPGTKRGEGKVTALVTKRDRVLASAIEGAVQRGESLEGLSSRKSDYVQGAKLGARVLGIGGSGGRGRGSGRLNSGRGGRGRGGRRRGGDDERGGSARR
ncbi:hypothetical protein ACHAXA_008794 [Cyclostephanos tholiformis]|uniref:Uncharacterized protein n=1 Tax=Cyclostephanos tholiformis TaxID=382380 RepID=A0ABD3SBL7_9STRA